MRDISSRPPSTQRRPSIRSISFAASVLSARLSPQTSTSCSSGCSRSRSDAALTEWSAETTRTPSGAISAACCAAEPCQTPSIRVALPLTAAASGTVASIKSCPGFSTSFKFVSVSEWLRNGTLRITISVERAASPFSAPEQEAPGTVSRARPAASSARPASREPITIGTPVRVSLSASPNPSAPEAPMIATGSAVWSPIAASIGFGSIVSGTMDEASRTVRIREVGPRDGFQNEPETIATDAKVELIDALARTGVRRIEATSFVRADVIPQLADAAEVLERIDVPEGVAVSVLVPNARGLDAALAQRERIDEINVFMSASETHNRNNVNRSIAESLSQLEDVLGRAREAGLRCEGVISTSFGCPYEGYVAPELVLEIAAALRDAGAQEIGFGDTTGMANPRQVREFFAAAKARLGADVELTAHFHNTRGQGLANVLAALDAGVDSFESSFGELGGCPVPPGATGNISSEDLVSMLHEMGIETGIDLPALLACARRVQEILGRSLGSHTIVAGPVDWSQSQ